MEPENQKRRTFAFAASISLLSLQLHRLYCSENIAGINEGPTTGKVHLDRSTGRLNRPFASGEISDFAFRGKKRSGADGIAAPLLRKINL